MLTHQNDRPLSPDRRRMRTLVKETIKVMTTLAKASRACDLPPAKIEKWLEDGPRRMSNAEGPPADAQRRLRREGPANACPRPVPRAPEIGFSRECTSDHERNNDPDFPTTRVTPTNSTGFAGEIHMCEPGSTIRNRNRNLFLER
jgi:hypothetical protein